MVNDIINCTEMMHSFQNIINRNAVSGVNRIGFKDHESRGPENRLRLETVCALYRLCDDVFFPVRNGCEPGCVIFNLFQEAFYDMIISESLFFDMRESLNRTGIKRNGRKGKNYAI